MTTTTTRLERITVALLQSDYVKTAYLEAAELVAMARLIELELDRCRDMDAETAFSHMEQRRLK